MNVLVTGGAGFIGSHLADALITAGHRVVVVDNLTTGNVRNINPAAVFHENDIRDKHIADIIISEEIEAVYHFAAQLSVALSVTDPFLDADINVNGTINLLEACKGSGVKKVIYASTAAVYGQPADLPIGESHSLLPISPYGVSKLTAEYYIRSYSKQYGFANAILRFANVYGERQNTWGEAGVIAIFIKKMLQGEQLKIYGDGSQTRDFVYVRDIIIALRQMLEPGEGELLLNIGCGSSYSINDMLHILGKKIDREQNIQYLQAREGDIRNSCLDIGKARDTIGWMPQYDFDGGLTNTISGYMSVGK